MKISTLTLVVAGTIALAPAAAQANLCYRDPLFWSPAAPFLRCDDPVTARAAPLCPEDAFSGEIKFVAPEPKLPMCMLWFESALPTGAVHFMFLAPDARQTYRGCEFRLGGLVGADASMKPVARCLYNEVPGQPYAYPALFSIDLDHNDLNCP